MRCGNSGSVGSVGRWEGKNGRGKAAVVRQDLAANWLVNFHAHHDSNDLTTEIVPKRTPNMPPNMVPQMIPQMVPRRPPNEKLMPFISKRRNGCSFAAPFLDLSKHAPAVLYYNDIWYNFVYHCLGYYSVEGEYSRTNTNILLYKQFTNNGTANDISNCTNKF